MNVSKRQKWAGIVGGSAIGIATLIVLAFIFTQGTFADVGGRDALGFATSSDDLYQVGNGMNFYGKQVSVENLKASKDSSGDIAVIKYGSESQRVTKQEFKEGVQIDDLKFSLVQIEDCYYYEAGFSLDSNCEDNIKNILYEVDVVVPKERITANVTDLTFEDVSEGVKKVDATIKVENNWNDFHADRVYVNFLGKQIDLDSGIIEKGENTYEVTFRKDYYDASKFLVSRRISDDLTVHFENTRVPQSDVSGKPEQDGDWRTFESFKPGGSKPDIQAIKEGDERYGSADSPCDIQYLKNAGLGTGDCYGYSGGSSKPMSTQNHYLELKDFRSISFTYSTQVNYCGEKATYRNGGCVIDEEVHVRGDLCPLLENHQIVTETFPAGEKISLNDLDPDPAFFCTKHPVLVTDGEGQQTEFITDPYSDLVDGETVQVPEGKTYTMYWTVNTDEVDVDTVCKEGSLNKTSGDCERTPGVTHVCSEGVFDPSSGSCVVEPEVQNICETGRYNSEFGKCQYEPDGNNECSVGYYDSATDSCLAPSTVKQVCRDDAVKEDGECRIQSAIVKQTPFQDLNMALDRVWDQYKIQILGVSAIFIVVIGGVVYIYFRRKRGSSRKPLRERMRR